MTRFLAGCALVTAIGGLLVEYIHGIAVSESLEMRVGSSCTYHSNAIVGFTACAVNYSPCFNRSFTACTLTAFDTGCDDEPSERSVSGGGAPRWQKEIACSGIHTKGRCKWVGDSETGHCAWWYNTVQAFCGTRIVGKPATSNDPEDPNNAACRGIAEPGVVPQNPPPNQNPGNI